MTTTTNRARRLRLACAAVAAGAAIFGAPRVVQNAYATEGVAGKCNVTCNSGSRCSAEGACTCTCSLIFDIATCTCTDGGSGGGGGGGTEPGEHMT